MEEKRIAGWRRPIAWIVCLLLFSLAGIVSDLLRKASVWAWDFISIQDTIVVVLLVLFLGGTFISIILWSCPVISGIILSISEAVFPTKTGLRYSITGGFYIIYYLLFIVMGALGIVQGRYMFLFYSFCVYMIVLSYFVIALGKSRVNGKQESNEE